VSFSMWRFVKIEVFGPSSTRGSLDVALHKYFT